jgi:hypothetical protein
MDGIGSVNTLSVKLSTAREGTSAAYVPGTGKVYIFGGYYYQNYTPHYLDEIVEFDPVAGSVHTLSVRLPTARRVTSAAYVPGTGKVYIFGGYYVQGSTSYYLDEIVEFDPVAGSVHTLSVRLPTARVDTAAAYAPETGKIYIFGGDEGGLVNEVIEFDPASGHLNAWSGVFPQGLSQMSAVYAPATGKVYVFGGNDGSYGTLVILQFDPATGQVSVLPARLPYYVSKSTSAAYAPETSKIYVFGGAWGSNYEDAIVEFDPVTGMVRELAVKLPSKRSSTSAAYAPATGKVYIFGGCYDYVQGYTGYYLDRIVEVRFDYYAWEQQAQSLGLDRWPIGIISATLSADQILNSQTVTYTLSNDGGRIWEDVALGVAHTFSDTIGSDLRWRANLSGNGKATPVIERLSIYYCPNRTMAAPVAPSLDPITNTNSDGYYPMSWNAIPSARTYVVEESSAVDFRNALVVSVTTQTNLWITRRELGTYYYRVQAWNARGNGDWSNAQQTTVTQRIAAPVLNSIDNAVGWSNYILTWDEIGPGVTSTVQRDASPSFSSPVTVYEGQAARSRQVVSELGTYYYRVKAADDGLVSGWSNTQSVQVRLLGPEPGNYTGILSVSFNVTANQEVCNFNITVPFGTGSCWIYLSSCAAINGNSFAFAQFELGAIYAITGAFDSRTHTSGSYYVSMCGGTIIIPGSSGTWEASR